MFQDIPKEFLVGTCIFNAVCAAINVVLWDSTRRSARRAQDALRRIREMTRV